MISEDAAGDWQWVIAELVKRDLAWSAISHIDPEDFSERVGLKTDSGILTEEARVQALNEALKN